MRTHTFRFAFLLSLGIHLCLVTVVEAGTFLISKAWDPFAEEPLITITTIRKAPPSGQVSPVSKGQSSPINYSSELVSSGQDSSLAETLKPKPPSGADQNKKLRDDLKQFEQTQLELDKRIQQFEGTLATQAAQNTQMISLDSIMSQVSDLEKVPVQVQKELLPTYLKRMRFKIADRWSRALQVSDPESGTATVRYQISLEGKVSNVQLLSFEGWVLFRESCLKAVREAAPFGPLPFDFDPLEQERYLTITLTFHLRKTNPEKTV